MIQLRNFGFLFLALAAILYILNLFGIVVYIASDNEVLPVIILSIVGLFVFLGATLLIIYVVLDRIKDAKNEKNLYDYNDDVYGSRPRD